MWIPEVQQHTDPKGSLMRTSLSVSSVRALVAGTTAVLLCAVVPVRADGLPGEYLLSSRWRDLLSQYSPLTNPALMSNAGDVTARFAFAPVMQGEFKLWEVGVTVPLASRHAVGVSLIGEGDGEIESAVFDDATGLLTTGGSTSSNDNAFIMLSYACRVWDRFSVGANLNIAYQSNFGDPLWGVGLDLGATFRLTEHSVVGRHILGLSTVNLLAPSMSSALFDFGNQGQYSRDLRLSWQGYFWDERVESGLDIDLKDIWANHDEFSSLEGTADAARTIEWGAAWRLGAWLRRVLAGYLQLGFGEDAIEYWGLAGGVRIAVPRTRLTVSAFYQYNIKTEGDLASSHTFYLLTHIRRKDRGAKEEAKLPKAEEPAQEPPPRAKEPARPEPVPEPVPAPDNLSTLRDIEGLHVEEQDEYVRITAEELAIHFASGASELPRGAIPALKEITAFLKAHPDHPVTIEGHTDADRITGSLRSRYRDNTALSEARARNVMDYFVERENLSASLFTIKGLGDSQPVAPNTTEEGKSRNRRVVITIRKTQGAENDK